MEEFTKTLGKAEIAREGMCVPKAKRTMFPDVGRKLVVHDGDTGSSHEVQVGSQCRLIMHSWYGEHKGIREGDLVKFQSSNGSVSIGIVAKKTTNPGFMFERKGNRLSQMESKVFGQIKDAVRKIERGDIAAIVKVGERGISIEWGRNIKSTEVTIGKTVVSLKR